MASKPKTQAFMYHFVGIYWAPTKCTVLGVKTQQCQTNLFSHVACILVERQKNKTNVQVL